MGLRHTSQYMIGQNGSVRIGDTTAVDGPFCAVQVINDAVLNATGTVISDQSGTAWTGITISAGTVIYGLFTAVQLVSGFVVAYKD